MSRKNRISTFFAVALVSLAASLALAAGTEAENGKMVLKVRAGGKNPDRFCMPEWSIANQTGQDVGALLVEIEWRKKSGEVLQPVGDFGTMVEPFPTGKVKTMFANGYQAACAELQVVVKTYACRDKAAVRIPCPGPIAADDAGAVKADLSGAKEGPMKGAVEKR